MCWVIAVGTNRERSEHGSTSDAECRAFFSLIPQWLRQPHQQQTCRRFSPEPFLQYVIPIVGTLLFRASNMNAFRPSATCRINWSSLDPPPASFHSRMKYPIRKV